MKPLNGITIRHTFWWKRVIIAVKRTSLSTTRHAGAYSKNTACTDIHTGWLKSSSNSRETTAGEKLEGPTVGPLPARFLFFHIRLKRRSHRSEGIKWMIQISFFPFNSPQMLFHFIFQCIISFCSYHFSMAVMMQISPLAFSPLVL